MTVVLCIDNNGGMMFNHRRQSQDRLLRERIISYLKGNLLWMNSYGADQFSDFSDNIAVSESFLQETASDAYCFVEDQNLTPYLNNINRIILYKWNRSYPADFKFTISLSDWTLLSSIEFAGSSHEKITEEIYVR
jgi:hypothetical protein